MSFARQYNKSFTIEVMELYKNSPCLWNSRCEDYNNQELRQAAMNNLIVKFAEVESLPSEYMVKNKFNSWKKSWAREYTKMITSNGEYIPTLWYFRHFDFIAKELLSNSDSSLEGEDNDIIYLDMKHEKSEEEDNCQVKHGLLTIPRENNSNKNANPEVEPPALQELPVIAKPAFVTQNASNETRPSELVPISNIGKRYLRRGRQSKHSKHGNPLLFKESKATAKSTEPSQFKESYEDENFKDFVCNDSQRLMEAVHEREDIHSSKSLKEQYLNKKENQNTGDISSEDFPGPRRSEKLISDNSTNSYEDEVVEIIDITNQEDKKNATDLGIDCFTISGNFEDATERICPQNIKGRRYRSKEYDHDIIDLSSSNLLGPMQSEEEVEKPPKITDIRYRNHGDKKNAAQLNLDDLEIQERSEDGTTEDPPNITQMQYKPNDGESRFVNLTTPKKFVDSVAELSPITTTRMDCINLQEPNRKELACSELAEQDTFENEITLVSPSMQPESQDDEYDIRENASYYIPRTKHLKNKNRQPNLMQQQLVENENDTLRKSIHSGSSRSSNASQQIYQTSQKRNVEARTNDIPISKRSKISPSGSRFDHLANYWAEKLKIINPMQRIFVEKLVSNLFCEAELGNLNSNSRIINSGSHFLAVPLDAQTLMELVGGQQNDRDLLTTIQGGLQMLVDLVSNIEIHSDEGGKN